MGAIVGELGMLSPSNMRTQTLECIEGGLILSVSYTKVEELYVQNPEFGFYFLRLSSARLFENIDKLEKRLAQQAIWNWRNRRHCRNPHERRQHGCVFRIFMESMRYLLADIIGEQDDRPAFLPDNLPEAVVPVASEAIHLLTEYQGTPYARVYVYRSAPLHRKARRRRRLLCEIARLMAMRMAYEDTIRIAQLKLIELQIDPDTPRADDIRKFRLDELVDVLPAVIAEPILGLL